MPPFDPWELNFDSAPFCNGSLHLGHVRTYALGDVRARWLRTKQATVRYTTTFDAFGVPNETGAARANMPTDTYVDQQIDRISRQLQELDLSYDETPIQRYCDPDYYRWTQWLFLKMYEAGLVYEVSEPLPFCKGCQDHLAQSQILNGHCWRCGDHVTSRSSRQWYIRSSDYFARLHAGIDKLSGWSDRARNILRSHMGKTDGIVSELDIQGFDRDVRVLVFGNTSLKDAKSRTSKAINLDLRSNHPLFVAWSEQAPGADRAVLTGVSKRRSDVGGHRDPIFGLVWDSQVFAVYPVSPRDIPKGMDALIRSASDDDSENTVFNETHTISSLSSRHVTVFRVQDWLISRNRTWGTPLPIVDCDSCGCQPVAAASLPVKLALHGGTSQATCSQCGAPQPLVKRVLDCFFDDSWCFYGTSPDQKPGQNPFEVWSHHPASRVYFHSGFDTYFYLHIFRFVGHFLFDQELTHDPEPIHFYHGHDLITADGRKMAKRLGNAPDLDELLSVYGSDVLRLAVLSNANPIKPVSWSADRLSQGQALLRTVQRLLDAPPFDTGGDDQVKCEPIPDEWMAHLDRIDSFIAEYRIGSALDTLYTVTKEFMRATIDRTQKTDQSVRAELLLLWRLFAPGIRKDS